MQIFKTFLTFPIARMEASIIIPIEQQPLLGHPTAASLAFKISLTIRFAHTYTKLEVLFSCRDAAVYTFSDSFTFDFVELMLLKRFIQLNP